MPTDLAQVQGATDQIPVPLRHDIRACNFAGVRQFTGNRLKNVGHGQDADKVAKLVDHKRNVSRLFAHLLQGIEDGEAVQQVDCLARHRLKVGFVTGQQFL